MENTSFYSLISVGYSTSGWADIIFHFAFPVSEFWT